MNAVKFPDMLSGGTNKTNTIIEKAASYQNLKYLLLSTKKTLLGDPYFGTRLKNLLYEKNNTLIKDLVIDEIVTAISTYMPQLYVQRKDIEVQTDRARVTVNIKAQNIIDYSFEDYTIRLLTFEEI